MESGGWRRAPPQAAGRPGLARLGRPVLPRARALPVDPAGGQARERSRRYRAGEQGGRTDPGAPAPGDRRAAAAERRGRPRADAQADRAAGAVQRRALVGRLRARGDARGPRAWRAAGARAVATRRGGHRAADGCGRALLPPDDPRLSGWRRLLHRGLGEPGSAPRIGGGSRTDAGLHPDRRDLGRGGCGGDHLGDPRPCRRRAPARDRRDRRPGRRQLARPP